MEKKVKLNYEKEVRWVQRLSNYQDALLRLEKNIKVFEKILSNLTEKERDLFEIYQNFEDHELSHSQKQEIESIEYKLDSLESAKMSIITSSNISWELGWKVMKDYIEYCGHKIRKKRKKEGRNGEVSIRTIETFESELKLIEPTQMDLWKKMINNRNEASHEYIISVDNIVDDIVNRYLDMFLNFQKLMISLKKK